ncbi:hypothetical protein RchiOBHm_Chr1g0367541 [Rosa chinensis]|uniref:Uncharacterized protein n=1 Tax=Rosa chinensis TaxID=74649 RepID=A0A2P6SKK8_ROSCH|nr:hypothetical protein RchiOBHm_Chr1g0367541 [Rosa chinensis]
MFSDGKECFGRVLAGVSTDPFNPARIRSALRLGVLDRGIGSKAWQGLARDRLIRGLRWRDGVAVFAASLIRGSAALFSLPMSWLLGLRSEIGLTVPVAGIWREFWARRRRRAGGAVRVAALIGLWWCLIGLDPCFLLAGSNGSWAWALVLGPYFYYIMFYCLLILVRCGFMPALSPYLFMVGRRGRCLGMHTQCALSSLARRRVICLIKWTQSPSGRMKLSATGFISVRQHSGKAVLFVMMLLHYRVIFPVCHRSVKANVVVILLRENRTQRA